jgi:ATP-dependent protease HslVU (ClpYQ) peptidase subunit
MTTIACDGKSMASDGQGDVADTIVVRTRCKIERLADGSLLGFAGNGHDGALLAAFLSDETAKPPKLDECAALRLFPDGSLHYISEPGRHIAVDPPCAIGSGMQFALGAMEAGSSPKEAVEIACRRDPFSGGKIAVLSP